MRRIIFEVLFTAAMAVFAYLFVVDAPSHRAALAILCFGIWLLGSMSITGWGFKKRPPLCVECGSDDMTLVDNVLFCRECENQQAVVVASPRVVPERGALAHYQEPP